MSELPNIWLGFRAQPGSYDHIDLDYWVTDLSLDPDFIPKEPAVIILSGSQCMHDL